MTGADGSPDRGAGPGWRWDVALSFASAQRHYVEQVASALTARGVCCFSTLMSRSSCGASTWPRSCPLDEAAQILRPLADAGDPGAAMFLAKQLGERDHLDELRARADADGGWVAMRLAVLLAERGDLDEAAQILRPLADAGDTDAADQMGELLAERGDLDRLRARADEGDIRAAILLVKLLGEHGDLDELRARADAGDWQASRRLPDLLVKQGRGEEAERLRRFGLNPDGSIACT